MSFMRMNDIVMLNFVTIKIFSDLCLKAKWFLMTAASTFVTETKNLN